MHRIFILLTIIFCSTIIYGQSINDSKNKYAKSTSKSSTEFNVNLPDTVQFREIVDKNETYSFFEKGMPWIAALFIGIFSAIVNFWISHRLRQSNERNLQKQIDNAKETTITQIKSTIGTKNRQEWITELRNTLSEYLTFTARVTPDMMNSAEDNKKYIEKIYYSKFKIALMINPEKKEQKELLDAVEDILSEIIKKKEDYKIEEFKKTRETCIQAARKLFGLHWKKIKDLK